MTYVNKELLLNDLPLLDETCKRIYEATFDYESQVLISELNSELNGEVVFISINSTVEKASKILDFLYSRKYINRYKEGKIEYNTQFFEVCFVQIVRPNDFLRLYEPTYPYVSLFSPSLWDINTIKRIRLIIELAKISPFPLENMFQYYINPSIDNLGARSLREFEKLVIEDLKMLVAENILLNVEIKNNDIYLYYSSLSLERLEIGIDMYLKPIDETGHKEENDIKHAIRYTRDRKIMLDNTYTLSRPNFDSENDNVFKFLYENPHKKWSREDIKKHIGQNLIKDFDKIVENLGFKGDLRKLFFEVSKTHIRFNNPIKKTDLEKLGIDRIRI